MNTACYKTPSPSLFTALLTLFFMMPFVTALGQQESSLWLFGPTDLGIKFDEVTKEPSVFTGKFTPYSSEGCSVISDPFTGNLLYYSDGLRVIDRSHQVMPNGNGLFGDVSSAQNGLSCPVPGQCNKYYVFSNDCAYENKRAGDLHYSIVDMSLPGSGTVASPFGDVEPGSKNIHILTNTSEALTIVKGSSRDEYWVLVPLSESSNVAVLKVSTAGIVQESVFDTGFPLTDIRNIRYSESAGKIAIVGLYGLDPVVICDFNNATGQLSNPFKVPGTPQANTAILYNGGYDAEWSPDGTKLYYSMYRWYPLNAGKLMQYDLNTPNLPAVIIYDMTGTVRGLKIGPDDKIYSLFSHNGTTRYIGIISDPDEAGTLCNFDPQGLDMGSDIGNANKFPDFLFYDNQPPNANDDIYSTCIAASDTILNVLQNDIEPDNDPVVLTVLNVSYGTAAVLANNSIEYTKPASFVGTDTIFYNICDTYCNSLCDSAFAIVCSEQTCDIPFQDIATLPSSCASASGSAQVNLEPGTDPGLFTYSWDEAPFGTNGAITNLSPGLHTVTIKSTDGDCSLQESFTIDAEMPNYSISSSSELCYAANGFAEILVSDPAVEIIWQDGNENFVQSELTSGTYYFQLEVPGFTSCLIQDSVIIQRISEPVYADFSFTAEPLDSAGTSYIVNFENLSESSTNTWSFGEGNTSTLSDPEHIFNYGVYTVTLSITDENGCSGTVSKPVVLPILSDCEIAMPDAFSPNQDQINEEIGILGYAPEVDLKIFNRWGEVIFATTVLEEKWDGIYRSQEVPGGLYPFILKYKCPEGGSGSKVGQILLIR